MFKTEVSHSRWCPFSIDLAILCNCDYVVSLAVSHAQDRPLLLEVFLFKPRGNHTLLGSHSSSLRGLMQSVEQTFPLTPSLKLTVDQASFRRKASFLQFVQSGLELNFMVAIDFTGSNGDPTYPNSLHHCDPNAFAHGGMNEYERTIAMVGDVLEFYDTDRQYPVYGFGAQLPSGCVSHCFPLTGDDSAPEVGGVAGIMNIYHQTLTHVRLSGPTFFAPIIRRACECVSHTSFT